MNNIVQLDNTLMVDGLNTTQYEILREMIDDTLGKAADAMEKMLRIRVKARDMDVGNGRFPNFDDFDMLGRFKVHLVKVEFGNEIRGAFYFIIKGHEVDLINSVCLPESVNNVKTGESKLMKHDFMLEIENMIASLSITEISDFLGVQLLGEVPVVKVMQGDQVNEYLKLEAEKNKASVHVKSVLAGVNVDVAPYFLWTLDHSFIDKLRLNVVG